LTPLSGEKCPEASTMEDLAFTVSSPQPLNIAKPVVSEPHARLCTKAESPCSDASSYPPGTSIEATASNFKLSTPPGSLTCESAEISGETLALGGEPLPLVMSDPFSVTGCIYKGVSGNCAVSFRPQEGSSISWGGGYGESEFQLKAELAFECIAGGSTFTCTYDFENADASVEYGKNPTAFVYNEIPLHTVKGNLCFGIAENKLTARFDVTNLGVFYVT
jgi:hypothetical protein